MLVGLVAARPERAGHLSKDQRPLVLVPDVGGQGMQRAVRGEVSHHHGVLTGTVYEAFEEPPVASALACRLAPQLLAEGRFIGVLPGLGYVDVLVCVQGAERVVKRGSDSRQRGQQERELGHALAEDGIACGQEVIERESVGGPRRRWRGVVVVFLSVSVLQWSGCGHGGPGTKQV